MISDGGCRDLLTKDAGSMTLSETGMEQSMVYFRTAFLFPFLLLGAMVLIEYWTCGAQGRMSIGSQVAQRICVSHLQRYRCGSRPQIIGKGNRRPPI